MNRLCLGQSTSRTSKTHIERIGVDSKPLRKFEWNLVANLQNTVDIDTEHLVQVFNTY